MRFRLWERSRGIIKCVAMPMDNTERSASCILRIRKMQMCPTISSTLRLSPGFDPRIEFTSVVFSAEINKLEDLKVDMVLPGVVTNVANFGAFVDIGVHQDGLMHISKMSNKFVKDPHDLVAVGDTIKVKVLGIDLALKRVSLEMVV